MKFKTTLCALTLALATSCINAKEPKPKNNAPQTYSFESFDRIKTYSGLKSLEVADFDGDGDLDFVVAYQDGGISLYENKIPQKKNK